MSPEQRSKLSEDMSRLAEGDRSAFDSIFELSQPLVFRLASKIVQPHQDADDVAQIALMKVFRRASEFRVGADALSWILGITAYECKTHRKKVMRRKEDHPETGQLETIKDDADSAEAMLIKKSLEDTRQSVLGSLSSSDQETILASVLEAHRPDVAPATFRKRLQRAMDRLKGRWEETHD